MTLEGKRIIMKKIGAYIHIPFCKQKCYYCDFLSFANIEKYEIEYVENLIKEINNFKEENKNIEFDTIYIGGGTPSYIDSKNIKQILKALVSEKDILKIDEITIEVNPGTFLKEKILEYKEMGINRLSIGLQSTNNKLLKQIGRIHTFEDFVKTYKTAREIGFDNINVDLMIGLPNQTFHDVKSELDDIINLKPNHISVYSLILEEGTILEQIVSKGKLKLPDEELERHMYWYVKDTLEHNGYKHYEISNFAKYGFESKHNLNCWEQKEYIGFGLGAHSYLDNVRFSNIGNLREYIENCQNNNFENNKIIHEVQDKSIKQKEYMLLGLRKIDGVNLQEFENIFSVNLLFLFKEELNHLSKDGLIRVDGNKIMLTDKGINLANIVWENFI